MQITLTGPTSDSTGSISKSQNALKSGPPASTPCPSLDDINGVLERLTLEGYGAKVASPMMDFAEQLKQHHALQEDSIPPLAPPPPRKKSDRPSIVVAIGEAPNTNSISDPNPASTTPGPDNTLNIPDLPVVLTLSPATPMEETTNPYLAENYPYGYQYSEAGYMPYVDVTRLFGSWNADEAMLPDDGGEECAKSEASASLEVIAESESENDVECERKLNEAGTVAPFSN
ncbi:hypothetical protein HWV62_7312 [Athelia sp. TMB]|nr:hypothetical protein HWV62_7312 [Athelia sp. TMB]